MIETGIEIRAVLDGTGISLCLDTGHLLIGGTDPAELARDAAGRIGHVYLKDVDAKLARQVADGEITYTEAVRRGICRPLGDGDVDVAGAIGALTAAGYDGWYVLEQDTILDGPRDGGGLSGAVARSLSYLRNLL